jgi:exodeoxyribonuclease VII small subunit
VSDQLEPPPTLEALQATAECGAFEEALHALEHVVDHLERGKLSIDEAVNWYEVGLSLTRRCRDLLDQAELRIGSLEEAYDVEPRDDEP